MTALLSAVGRTGLSAAVMILAVMTLRVWFQERTPRRVFCLLWDLTLVRLLVLAELPSPVSIRRWLPQAAPASVAGPETAAVILTDGSLAIREAYSFDVLESGTACRLIPATSSAPDWGGILFVLWLAGVLSLAGWFLWSHWRFRRMYADSLPVRESFVLDWLSARPLSRPVQVRTSDRIAAPLTYGIVYPVILLPRGMEDREVLSCVLSHEYEHIRRFDALRKALLALALCLHWFNPLVWALYVLANRDMELNCDEAVLRSGADRERYALALLGLEERRGSWNPTGSHFSSHALEERIKTIMKRKHISLTALTAVLVVMAITTTVFASAAPEGREDQNASGTGRVHDHLEVVKDEEASVISRGGENGETFYSLDDGITWMSEERYQAEYGSWGDGWQVEWWTWEEYKAWLEQERKNLQEMIGERSWTPSTGWFTWDQEKVDEAIAMYEEILEKIKNGALYSKTIIDKNGKEVEDAALGSDAPLNMVIASTFDVKDMVSTAPRPVDKAALLEELKTFGIEGSENLMTFGGRLIRHFVDGVPVGDNGYSVRYVYTNPDGVVDVHTLRAVIFNPDGSYDAMGELTGVVTDGDEGFSQELIDCAVFPGRLQAAAGMDTYWDQRGAMPGGVEQTAHAVGAGSSGGRSLEEIFARYAEYGLVYQPRESGAGALTWNGQPVRSFADLKPDGGAFSYEDPYARDGLTVYTEYGQDGKLTGLTVNAAPAGDGKAGAGI